MAAVLHNLIQVSNEVHALMPYAQLSITDTEMYIHAIPGDNFFLEVFSAGHTFLDGSIAQQTVTTGKVVTRMGNNKLTGGIPYQGTGVPLYEDGILVGALCMFYATTNREAMQNMSEDIGATVEELHSTLESFRSSMEALTRAAEVMDRDSAQMGEASTRIHNVTDFIAKVSSKTKLLGFNAAIEAVHAREYGAGFTVIAAEVGRLSEEVTKSVSEIKDTTDHLVYSLERVQTQIRDVFWRIQEGYEATETFSSVSGQLVRLSERLQDLSQIIKM
ncbi:methyl-accepting chemotaxis protein [Alicyclobacillus mengziensis]|uniref:Methyl-accepting chemotaxis protein n=1 Tax=Alicyclobacillus mengziensis TaxID=2931921 RepID=A0A9X7VWU4_9BACL|nr:methyl-accepting chemotaxis protein [Alicyclobacillus mengziensis]QSO46526.1 methyl-accepting chemotaxis protein [Alicyclobacillus mengziensis]